ncbi:secretion/conjugation apparatus DotM-related subunit [Salinimonas chungwhensis]|uniref:secretion/conjugation apparatus DotM-related subunit n=1 Tax=Salinimonas chungwhensis TaxID=265425 RepID=UPI00035FD099|nr:hypothetical protein [Salinimonas chungwhensis]
MAKGHDPDNDYSLLYGAAAISLMCFVGWYFSKEYINYSILAFARFNFEILRVLLQTGDTGSAIVALFAPGLNSANAPNLAATMYSSNPNFMEWNETLLYLEFLGQNLRPFLIVILVFSGVRVWRSQRQKGLTKKYDLDMLYKKAAQYYPHLNPVIAQDLIEQDPDVGNLAREKSPIINAIENGLVLVHDVDHLDMPTDETMVPTFDKSLNKKKGYFYIEKNLTNMDTGIPVIHRRCSFLRDNAQLYFVQQLGEKYTSWRDMRLERRAVMAICSLFMKGVDSGGVKQALELNKRINERFTLKGTKKLTYIDDAEINSIIESCEDRPQFKRLIAAHSYELTLISSFIEEARTKGKLYFSNMYWIKHTDRALWYNCDQEGGQKAWSESAAVRAHLLRERSVGMGLEKPHILAAVKGLEKFLGITEGWLIASGEDIKDA